MLEALRSGRLSLGPDARARSSRRSPSGSASPHASAVSSGTAGLHLAVRAAGDRAAATRSITTPFSFVASANCLLYEGAGRCSATSTRARSTSTRGGRGGGRDRAHDGHAAGAHLRLPGRHAGVRAARGASAGCGSSRTPARRSARVHGDGTPVGARGNLAVFAFYPNKQMTTGEGGMVVCPTPARKERIDSRAQPGPRAGHGLARPRPARLQLPARPTSPARSGWRSSSGSTSCSPAARAWPRCTTRRSRASRGSSCPARTSGGDRRSWFVYVVQLPRRGGPRRAIVALRERGVDSKPYLPAIHLMSFYRERFGHREGEFPVCEDVAAPLARAAVLPAADRGPGGAGGRGVCARCSAAVRAPVG